MQELLAGVGDGGDGGATAVLHMELALLTDQVELRLDGLLIEAKARLGTAQYELEGLRAYHANRDRLLRSILPEAAAVLGGAQ